MKAKLNLYGCFNTFVLCVIASYFTGCVSSSHQETHKRMISQVFETRGAQGIDLEVYAGEVRLQQSDEQVVRIEGEVRMRGRDIKALDKYLAELKAEAEYGKRLKISVPRPGINRHYTAKLDVTVPKDLNLNISLRYGSLKADIELPMETKMQMKAGDIDVDLPEDTVVDTHARAKIGAVKIAGFSTMDGASERRRVVGARYDGQIGDSSVQTGKRLDLTVTAGEVEIRGHGADDD